MIFERHKFGPGERIIILPGLNNHFRGGGGEAEEATEGGGVAHSNGLGVCHGYGPDTWTHEHPRGICCMFIVFDRNRVLRCLPGPPLTLFNKLKYQLFNFLIFCSTKI